MSLPLPASARPHSRSPHRFATKPMAQRCIFATASLVWPWLVALGRALASPIVWLRSICLRPHENILDLEQGAEADVNRSIIFPTSPFLSAPAVVTPPSNPLPLLSLSLPQSARPEVKSAITEIQNFTVTVGPIAQSSNDEQDNNLTTRANQGIVNVVDTIQICTNFEGWPVPILVSADHSTMFAAISKVLDGNPNLRCYHKMNGMVYYLNTSALRLWARLVLGVPLPRYGVLVTHPAHGSFYSLPFMRTKVTRRHSNLDNRFISEGQGSVALTARHFSVVDAQDVRVESLDTASDNVASPSPSPSSEGLTPPSSDTSSSQQSLVAGSSTTSLDVHTEIEIRFHSKDGTDWAWVHRFHPTSARLLDVIVAAFENVNDPSGLHLLALDKDGIETSLQSDADLQSWLSTFTSEDPRPTCWFEEDSQDDVGEEQAQTSVTFETWDGVDVVEVPVDIPLKNLVKKIINNEDLEPSITLWAELQGGWFRLRTNGEVREWLSSAQEEHRVSATRPDDVLPGPILTNLQIEEMRAAVEDIEEGWFILELDSAKGGLSLDVHSTTKLASIVHTIAVELDYQEEVELLVPGDGERSLVLTDEMLQSWVDAVAHTNDRRLKCQVVARSSVDATGLLSDTEWNVPHDLAILVEWLAFLKDDDPGHPTIEDIPDLKAVEVYFGFRDAKTDELIESYDPDIMVRVYFYMPWKVGNRATDDNPTSIATIETNSLPF